MFNPNDFPEPRSIPVNGIVLEVFEAGKENAGKPIILCHGWPEHAFSWRHQIPALVSAGYHVIIPNQRGYGNSSCPVEVDKYDIEHLTADLAALLDFYNYKDAVFMGHDWGAMVVWWMALLKPDRVKALIALSVPYQERGERPWIEWMEEVLGRDYYFVHFNRRPGEADAVLDENSSRFLHNLFRKNEPVSAPLPGMMMINLAVAEAPKGEPLMSEEELSVFTDAFKKTGFSGSINWYRNLDRNWHLLKDIHPIIRQPALMIYGTRDLIPEFEKLPEFVPSVEITRFDCGHWVQQEEPEQTNSAVINWLKQLKINK